MDETAPSYLVRSGRSWMFALRVAVLLASVVGVPLAALWGGYGWSSNREQAVVATEPRGVERSRAGAQVAPGAATDDARIVEMLHRLQRAGALYYRLDRDVDASHSGAFVFQCRMQGAASTFAATEPNALSAIGKVLVQVEGWLAARQATRTRGPTETARRDEYIAPRR
jgi:hypothetical protein